MSDASAGNDCGCCEGLRDRTPAPLFNRPGLSQIAYRSGTWGLFRQSMLAGLSRADRPALGGLRTRADEDLSIALIDAWAVAGDVLTFAIERVAQEHYLPTATERRSVDDLVQLIGYHLRPGVAASTWLAFTLETAPAPANPTVPRAIPGIPTRVPIDIGAKVKSIPGPGELSQTFETVEAFEALADWNTLHPRLTAPRIPATGDQHAWLSGVGLNLAPGDLLLFVADDWDEEAPDDRWDLRRVVAVEPDAEGQRTRVRWHGSLANLDAQDPPIPVSLFALRQRASLFGYNAPDPRLFSTEVRTVLIGTTEAPGPVDGTTLEWKFDAITASALTLDAVYPGIEPDSWVVLKPTTTTQILAQIASVAEVSKSRYAISARVTELVLDRDNEDVDDVGGTSTRGSSILLDSEPLPLAEAPLTEPVAGQTVPIATQLDPITAPRTVVVRGKLAEAISSDGQSRFLHSDDGDMREVPASETFVVLTLELEPEGFPGMHRWLLRLADGFEGELVGTPDLLVYPPASADAPFASEVATVAAIEPDGATARLVLDQPLRNVYDRTSTVVFGNVAEATHGETVADEVLGSGDGAKPYQQFTLRKDPLTYVRGDPAGSTASTLEVWVNQVRWSEVPTLYEAGPRDRVYITRITDDGKTVVQFGDGVSGARLPTGQNNVVATYRAGTGLGGQVQADQLSLLMTRPLGVRGVTNPRPAEGAADRQEAEDARDNAPRSVLTLERIVALQDYEDFAQDFLGIAKAAAVWTWDGSRRGVLITVAGIDGATVPDGEGVHDDLVAAITAAGPRRVPLVVTTYRPVEFGLKVSIRVDPDRDPETVREAVREALAAGFSFATRAFGQNVTLSEIYAAIHAVPGVTAADVDHLYRGATAQLEPFLVADAPVDGDPPTKPGAELLTLPLLAPEAVEVLP